MHAGVFPLVAGATNHIVDQFSFEVQTHAPEIIVGDVFDPLPHGRIIKVVFPIRAQIAVVEHAEPAGKPCAGVDTIGNVRDRNFLCGRFRPKVLPHLTRDFAVQL